MPEGSEERNMRAADEVLAEGFADIILIGDQAEIEANAQKWGLQNISKATIVDPKTNAKMKEYADLLYNLRKNKGMTEEQASELAKNPLYLGCLMIKSGDADGEVSGAINATGDVL